MYFLVLDSDNETFVFLEEDPRRSGFSYPVVADVELESLGSPGAWTSGTMQSDRYLGRAPGSATRFRIFNSAHDCSLANYEPLGSVFQACQTWEQYLRSRATPTT